MVHFRDSMRKSAKLPIFYPFLFRVAGGASYGEPLALAGWRMYHVGGVLTPFPVAVLRRSGTNNGMNVSPLTIPALLASNGTGTTGEAGRTGDSGQDAARGIPSDKREGSAPGKAGHGVRSYGFLGTRVPGKRCHAQR